MKLGAEFVRGVDTHHLEAEERRHLVGDGALFDQPVPTVSVTIPMRGQYHARRIDTE
jgi:hypothetical protein